VAFEAATAGVSGQACENELSLGFQHSTDVFEKRHRGREMFDHLKRDDRVEGIVLERQMTPRPSSGQ